MSDRVEVWTNPRSRGAIAHRMLIGSLPAAPGLRAYADRIMARPARARVGG